MREYVIGIRKLKETIQMRSPKAAAELLSELKGASVEVLTVIPVSKDLEVREMQTCAVGSMMSVTVEARNIFQEVVHRNEGHGIIVAHNHAFQKRADPSSGDRDFVHGLKSGGNTIGVPIVDSIVIGEEEYYSFVEHGLLFQKSLEYGPLSSEPIKKLDGMVEVVPVGSPCITSPKKAVDAVSFLCKEKVPLTAILHMTPDFELSKIQVFPFDPKISPKREASIIMREAISSHSTKYFLVAGNYGLFEKRPQFDDDLSERINHIRLGSTTLCIPMLDMIILEPKGFYSFAEHGRIFPKSRIYVSPEHEGLKMKGPSKVRRADIPPYSWTFR